MLEARETSLIAGNVLFILLFKKAGKRPSCNLVFKPIAKYLPYMCHLLLARGSRNDLMVGAVGSGWSHLGSLLCSKTRHFARTVSLSTPEYCQSHLQNTVGG